MYAYIYIYICIHRKSFAAMACKSGVAANGRDDEAALICLSLRLLVCLLGRFFDSLFVCYLCNSCLCIFVC